jgi:myo-inositol 2-dehydrogenase / D-chiro-inositol 1-dehydrogenase
VVRDDLHLPIEVFATGVCPGRPRLLEYDDADTSVAALRLPGDALGQIDSARRTSYGYDERIEIMGSGGMVEAGRHRTGAVSRYPCRKNHRRRPAHGLLRQVQPTYAAACSLRFRAERRHDHRPSLIDGLKAQAIAEAASLRSGKTEKIHYGPA